MFYQELYRGGPSSRQIALNIASKEEIALHFWNDCDGSIEVQASGQTQESFIVPAFSYLDMQFQTGSLASMNLVISSSASEGTLIIGWCS